MVHINHKKKTEYLKDIIYYYLNKYNLYIYKITMIIIILKPPDNDDCLFFNCISLCCASIRALLLELEPLLSLVPPRNAGNSSSSLLLSS